MTLRTLLHEADARALLRAYRSDKAYLYFSVSVFNTGVIVSIKCTEIYKAINYGGWNGYDQIHENDSLMKTFMLEVIKERGIDI